MLLFLYFLGMTKNKPLVTLTRVCFRLKNNKTYMTYLIIL